MLDKHTLRQSLENLKFEPDIDPFDSGLNRQFILYAAYKPDHNAMAIDAFTMQWALNLYARLYHDTNRNIKRSVYCQYG